MKNRLIENYVTTGLGIAIILFCGVLLYQQKQTASDLSGWFATGLLFLRSKDSLINLPKERKFK